MCNTVPKNFENEAVKELHQEGVCLTMVALMSESGREPRMILSARQRKDLL